MMQLVPAAGRIGNPLVFLDGDWPRYALSTHDYSILQLTTVLETLQSAWRPLPFRTAANNWSAASGYDYFGKRSEPHPRGMAGPPTDRHGAV
jgi:hypothetical protein